MTETNKKVKGEEKKTETGAAQSECNGLLARFFIWFDKQIVIGDSISSQRCYGRFFVLYNNGMKSQSFSYQTACGYANIFGGKVYHKRTGIEC